MNEFRVSNDLILHVSIGFRNKLSHLPIVLTFAKYLETRNEDVKAKYPPPLLLPRCFSYTGSLIYWTSPLTRIYFRFSFFMLILESNGCSLVHQGQV